MHELPAICFQSTTLDFPLFCISFQVINEAFQAAIRIQVKYNGGRLKEVVEEYHT